jgi:DNA-binding transcriptional regulator GbsR (MarR family)
MELTETEYEVVDFWMRFAQFLGFQRSVGQVYGLIFLSEDPVHADFCVEKLGISRSSVGHSLTALQEAGAIRKVLKSGSRKEHYRIETDLQILLNSYLNRKAIPTLEGFRNGLAQIKSTATEEHSETLLKRIEKIEKWQMKLAPVLHFVKQRLR